MEGEAQTREARIFGSFSSTSHPSKVVSVTERTSVAVLFILVSVRGGRAAAGRWMEAISEQIRLKSGDR